LTVRTILCSTLALAAALALTPARPLPADTAAKKAAPVVVPFELLASGHMAVQVKANGKGPFLLIFDTGAPMSLVNNKMAKEAGLLKGVQKPAFTMFGSMGEVKIKKLQVGDATEADVSAMVMDHPTITLIADKLKKPICGLVGFPFFARFKMTLDYEKRTMTLVPSGYKPPDVMKSMTMLMLGGAGKRSLAPAAQWGVMASKEPGDEGDGVDVKSVVPGSAADKAGLKRGDRLLTLDGRWTDTIADLYEAAGFVKPGSAAEVKIRRGGKEMSLKVSPVKGL
jgi:hypothetical protein